jgi:hypothetical protein
MPTAKTRLHLFRDADAQIAFDFLFILPKKQLLDKFLSARV